MSFAELVEPLFARGELTADAARDLMSYVISDEATDAQRGAALTLMRMKPLTGEELAAYATVLRDRSLGIETGVSGLVDTCGTGGGPSSFNLSTAALFVAAGAGVPIAKHGNRAVTSQCGSADVLEALGVALPTNRLEVVQSLRACGIAFMLAPSFHPAMKAVGPVRRQLGYRTVFNVLGPLLNPAQAERQLIGVYSADLIQPVAEALDPLGVRHGFVVHAASGHDEASAWGETLFAEARDGKVTRGVWTPASFGLDAIDVGSIGCGRTVAENAAILREAITDVGSRHARAILPNAAIAILLGERAPDLVTAAAVAQESIRSGAAVAKLDALVEASSA